MREIDHHPVVDNLAVDHFPEIHVADLDRLAGRLDPHEGAGMHRFLMAEGGRPFAHIEPGLVDTDLVGERRLKGTLPVVLEFLQTGLGAATGIAHPAEPFGEEVTDIIDPVVIQPIDHSFDYAPRLVGLGHVSIAAKYRLFRA